jgi:hypothetical protein
MKVLLDECLPRKLKRSLLGHDCQTVPEAGFAGMRNGELLLSAEKAGFDVFLTLDRGIEFQQRLKNRKIGIVLLRSKTSRLQDLEPQVSEILAAIVSIRAGQLVHVGR